MGWWRQIPEESWEKTKESIEANKCRKFISYCMDVSILVENIPLKKWQKQYFAHSLSLFEKFCFAAAK